MTRAWLRFGELVALTLLAIGLLALAGYMVSLNRVGEAFGSVVATLPLVVQAIRNIGQSSAMQSMADHLAASQPVPPEQAP